MGIIKICANDQTDWKLISAKDFKSLQIKAEEKLGFKIKKFVRPHDGCAVDDNEIFESLTSQENELKLVALKDGEKLATQLKTSKLNSSLNSESSISTTSTLQNNEKDLKSVITKEDTEDDDDDDDEDEFFRESDFLKKMINDFKRQSSKEDEVKNEDKKSLLNTSNKTKEKNKTVETFEKEKKEALDKIIKEKEVLEKKQKEKELTVITSGKTEDEKDETVEELDTITYEKMKKEAMEKIKKEKQILDKKKKEQEDALEKKIKDEEKEKKKKRAEELSSLNSTLDKLQTVNKLLDTEYFEKQKKEALDKIKKEEEDKEKIKKRAEEMTDLNTTVVRVKAEKDKLDAEYRKRLFQSQVTLQKSKTELEIAEARLAELDLKKQKISNIFVDLIEAEKVDFCFLVDCTASMDIYINEVKTTIHQIVDKLKKRFTDFELRCSFVGYRDHSDGKDRIAIFDFNNSIDKFKTFVSSVKAKGGADQCEDVFGGLSEVIKQDWQHMSRILFHIGDAPCHGTRFHNDALDDYPDGHPDDPEISDLIKSLVDKQINYYFTEINSTTLKMIEEFDKELLEVQGNKIQVYNLKSDQGLADSISISITKTINDSKSMSMHSTKRDTKLKTIVVNPILNWSEKSMRKCNADYYTATYDGTIAELKTKQIEFKKKRAEIYIAPKPFAKGNMRFAYNGYLKDEGGLKKVVIKQSAFKDDKYNTMAYYKEMIETQIVSKLLTDKFLEVSRSDKSVKFIDVDLIHIDEDGAYYSIEEFFDGKFVKWMNNAGVIDEDIYSCTVDAFSHWSYLTTDKYLIVTDLQGFIHNDREYVLTDPAISCPEHIDRFSSTNLGVKGIKKYFETHQCNDICRDLKLKKHKDQKRDDRPRSLKTKIKKNISEC